MIAFSTMGLHISAFKWYIKQQMGTSKRGADNLKKVTDFCKAFYKGFQKDIAQRKLDGKMKTKEGKNAATFQQYEMIARMALFAAASFPLVHVFVVLCWNLMCRSHSAAVLMYAHISTGADCLTFVLPKQKNDVEGEKGFAKHVYANPFNPTLCPVFALALWVFTRSNSRQQYNQIVL